MSKFSPEELPMEDLKALGLIKDGQLNLEPNTKDALLNGRLTKMLHMNDIKVDGLGTNAIDAKLSLARKEDGMVGLYVHPIYQKPTAHPNLSPEENNDFARGGAHAKHSSAYGTITDSGFAPYEFNEKNSKSFYIELEKNDGERTKVWGIDLHRALTESGKQNGDKVQLDFMGKQNVKVEIDGKWEMKERYEWQVNDFVPNQKREQTFVYEFDKETNSFAAVDSNDVRTPEEINGMPLSEEQKRKFRRGQVVELPDSTAIQASPIDSEKYMRSNRRFLLASMLLDGGLSFLVIKGIEMGYNYKLGKKEKEQQLEYNKGYRDALSKVQADLERKSLQYPNNKYIIDDLNTVKTEYSRTANSTTYKDAKEKDINETKAVVNDPELDDNAEREQKEERYEKQQNKPIAHGDEESEYEETRKAGRGR